MDDDKKDLPPILKWALITLHPSLPSETEQVAAARTWGLRTTGKISDTDMGPFNREDVRKVKRTTNWPSKLPERARFIERRKVEKEAGIKGVEVFFATPLCVGFSPAHAEQTMRALWDAGVSVYVHSINKLYQEGDDLADFLRKVSAEANTAHVRAHRKREAAKEAKKKEKAEAKRLAAERNTNT